MKIMDSLDLIIIMVVLLFVSGNIWINAQDGFGSQISKYNGVSDITVEHNTESVTGKIEIIDTYTKGGEKYLEIKTSVTGNEVFTFSQAEYDSIFGEGNDAFDTQVYELKTKSDIVKYKDNFLEMCKITFCKKEDLTSYLSDNGIVLETTNLFPSSTGEWFVKYLYLNESIKVGRKIEKNRRGKDYESLVSEYKETRYSIFGESDFTEDEIQGLLNQQDKINRLTLEAFNF